MRRHKLLKYGCLSNKNGYTMIEVLVSLMLASFIIVASFSLFSQMMHRYNESVAEKELVESADYLEQVIKREFSRASGVLDYLDPQGAEHYEVGSEPAEFICISLKRTRFTLYQSGYAEAFLIDGKYRSSLRKPVYISKEPGTSKSSKNYRDLSIFEVGNHVSSMSISRIDESKYRIWLELEYQDTEVTYSKNFIAELQNA